MYTYLVLQVKLNSTGVQELHNTKVTVTRGPVEWSVPMLIIKTKYLHFDSPQKFCRQSVECNNHILDNKKHQIPYPLNLVLLHSLSTT